MRKLADELTDAFIQYQWRQENPMPTTTEREDAINAYRNHSMFHNRVTSLVAGVLNIVDKHCISKDDINTDDAGRVVCSICMGSSGISKGAKP